MRELTGDIWKVAKDIKADAIAVTTNLCVRKDGKAVMGAGIALDAVRRYPGIDKTLGERIIYWGKDQHYVYRLTTKKPFILSFPTKNDWRKPSLPKLIEKSAIYLKGYADSERFTTVVLPRPGCGLGGLKWPAVKKILDPILDDRFVVVWNG